MALTQYSALPAGLPDISFPRADRLLQGNPQRETWNQVEQPVLGASTLSSGIWRCEPGHWRVVFPAHQQEVFTVLSGHCKVHDTLLGTMAELRTGDVLHMPAGFVGSFEVIETVIKSYVIVG